ncbi:DEKNAAC102518 [Brettanomyces naardenensis]|uniref:DEKNAAC102518 n=1 Tax=Brettanomyces naardenensis TaxID=13370 RepID=A0A448YKD3_BRENA|nr:DEKNAAC102518 [Brettanomyces naardenensis]
MAALVANVGEAPSNSGDVDVSTGVPDESGGYMSLPTSDIQRALRGIGEQVVQEIYLDDDNAEKVEHFKYKHELRKHFSVASIVGLGFSLMNVPFGISTTLSLGLVCGGSVTIFWGWLIFGIFTILICLSLSEIASKFPSSGGVYHFSFLLANEKYGLVASWFTGWFLIIGNWLMFISCAFGGSQFILSIFGLKQSDYKHDDYIVLLVYIALVVLAALFNLKFQKYLEKLNRLCIYWTIYTILIMDFFLLVFSTEYHDLSFIFTHFDATRTGWPSFLAFLIGAIQFPAMTFNGYGSIASMSEEVKDPEKTIPKGMIYAVLISALIGLSFILPILTILPDLTKLLDDNPDIFPIDIVFKLSTKSFVVSIVLVLLIVGSLSFAIIGTLTTASRVVYAFGRDHGLPFDYLWQKVDTMEDEEIVPKNALLLSVGFACIMGLFSLVSASAFSAFIGCSVIALNIANGIPILSSLLNKRRKIRGAVFKLRKFGYVVNILSCVFVLLTIVLLSFPPSRYIDVKTMNYAFFVFFLFAILVGIAWIFWGKKYFQGPQIDHDDFIENGDNQIPPTDGVMFELENVHESRSEVKNNKIPEVDPPFDPTASLEIGEEFDLGERKPPASL